MAEPPEPAGMESEKITENIDCAVIGAGVIGLAIARALALAGREVLVLEKEAAIGSGASSRNSEVIHAGIYYPPSSLKARLCVRGRALLYDYCARHGISHRKTAKLIVATRAAELATLEVIRDKAVANGVDDLALLDARAAIQLEPNLSCVGALLSPSTGIVDSHALMLALQGEAQASGAVVALNAPVLGGTVSRSGVTLSIGSQEPMALRARLVVNAAGLWAPGLARTISGLAKATIPRDYLCKGSYFALHQRSPFSRLIYPVPEAAGLGVHLTLDLGGQARFGPDVEWVEGIDYRIDPGRADGFYAAIRRYWPGLPDGALVPGYAGIRPKISGPSEPAADFVIQGPKDHGTQGLINLYGIESPGLTASLAIAEAVAAIGQI